ncbi:MAG TPA: efflux RND transporter permease subunit, partial [Kiloniellaceae bacterium]|nr:efflux RND transporter permease subunit [Kiloniellaceae bacterium]
MDIIKLSIMRPIAVLAAVLMTVMFGLVALDAIPIQLAPDVNRPVISITTTWPSAAPAEIEREIVNRQEEVLTGIPGLATITSQSEQGRGRVTLEFDVGTNMDRALLLVSNRLDRVNGYPAEADEPTLKTAGSEDNAIAWFIVTRLDGNTRPIYQNGDFIEDVVQDRLERVPGVGEVNVYGGSEREIQITVAPEALARYGLTVPQVVQALRNANAAISAGDVEEGKRRYTVRTEAELNTLEDIGAVVLRSEKDPVTGRLARVTVSDIADVDFSYKEPVSTIRLLSQSAIAMNAKREVGANVIETMAGIQEAIDELNDFAIPNAGLKLQQVYDETDYINSAIDLVRQNIWIGGSLAAIILLLFLRSARATLVVSLAIPVSVVGSFVAMAALGRSINVISLAGFAFAVGMVVDAAIVVLENIFRLQQSGKPAREAAYLGAKQVWGAVLVSALTTVMVFIPILIMELEVGQLFRDIAVAISVSVLLSLLVSVTVLPALASRLLGPLDYKKAEGAEQLRLPVIDHFARGFVAVVLGFTRFVVRHKAFAVLVVVLLTAVASAGAWRFLPKLEYLPDGNRNLMFGLVIPPPGYNLETMTEIAERIEDATRPYWASEAGTADVPDQPPKIDRFFFVAFRANTFVGAAAVNPQRAAELRPLLSAPVYQEPGTFALINQLSIFGRGIGGGRKIELDISGPDLETNLAVAGQLAGRILHLMPVSEGNQFRPNPGLELGAPEVRVIPDRLRLADNGVSALDLGQAVDTF